MTRHAMLLALAMLARCATDDDEPDGTKIELVISSPTPFDRLLVATSMLAVAAPSEPVLTPELLASGDAPTSFALWSGSFLTLDFAPAAEANDYDIYTPALRENASASREHSACVLVTRSSPARGAASAVATITCRRRGS